MSVPIRGQQSDAHASAPAIRARDKHDDDDDDDEPTNRPLEFRGPLNEWMRAVCRSVFAGHAFRARAPDDDDDGGAGKRAGEMTNTPE